MRRFIQLQLFIVLILSGMMVMGCATAPRHPSLLNAELPDLIPIRELFISTKTNFDYHVSPDGKKIAWLAVKNRRLTIYFRTIGKDDVKIVDTHSPRNIYSIKWAQDSRRILYLQDQEGNENHHVYLVDTDYPDQRPVDLTPFEGTRAWVHQTVRSDPAHILICHNRRDETDFDLYRVDLDTREQTLIARSPGGVLSWITDQEGHLRGRISQTKSEKRILEVPFF